MAQLTYVFILKTLIDKYVKSIYKPLKKRNLLFSCFVDFSEAFDHIPRQKLFDKLRKKKDIQGRLLQVSISMYSNDNSAVKLTRN